MLSVQPPALIKLPAVPKSSAARRSASAVAPSPSNRLPVSGISVISSFKASAKGARQEAVPLCPGMWNADKPFLLCSVIAFKIGEFMCFTLFPAASQLRDYLVEVLLIFLEKVKIHLNILQFIPVADFYGNSIKIIYFRTAGR